MAVFSLHVESSSADQAQARRVSRRYGRIFLGVCIFIVLVSLTRVNPRALRADVGSESAPTRDGVREQVLRSEAPLEAPHSAERYDFKRFIDVQDLCYESEVVPRLTAGENIGPWMQFIFPSVDGHYGISSLEEAREYVAHPILGRRLQQCVVLALVAQRNSGKTAAQIFGDDERSFMASMTMFDLAHHGGVFSLALDKFFNGRRDEQTLGILQSNRWFADGDARLEEADHAYPPENDGSTFEKNSAESADQTQPTKQRTREAAPADNHEGKQFLSSETAPQQQKPRTAETDYPTSDSEPGKQPDTSDKEGTETSTQNPTPNPNSVGSWIQAAMSLV